MDAGKVTSFIIGGFLLLSVMKLNTAVMSNSAQSTMDLTAKTNVETLSEIISFDLRKIGYNNTGISVYAASSVRLSFVGDLDNDGTVDSVIWQADTSVSLPATENPADFPVYRIVNGDTTSFFTSTTVFELSYYDSKGSLAAGHSDIRGVQVEMTCESPESVGAEYIQSSWEKRFYPRNI